MGASDVWLRHLIGGKLTDCDGDEVPIVPDDKVGEVKERIESGEVTTTEKLAQVVRGGGPVPTEHSDSGLEATKSLES